MGGGRGGGGGGGSPPGRDHIWGYMGLYGGYIGVVLRNHGKKMETTKAERILKILHDFKFLSRISGARCSCHPPL